MPLEKVVRIAKKRIDTFVHSIRNGTPILNAMSDNIFHNTEYTDLKNKLKSTAHSRIGKIIIDKFVEGAKYSDIEDLLNKYRVSLKKANTAYLGEILLLEMITHNYNK